MKLRTLLLALLAFSLTATLFAADPKLEGSGSYGTETLETLKGTGIVKLYGTTINQTLQVAGSLIAQDAHIGTLDITGEANLTDTIIRNGGTILGSFQAVHSTFEKAITILSQKATFTSTHLEGITVQKDTGYKGKQVIELKQGSIVHGPIHFESGKGEIVLHSGSQVLGSVTGGKIIKKG